VYPQIFGAFTVWIGFPGSIMISVILLSLFFSKREDRIPLFWRLVVDCGSFAVLFGVGGFYLEGAITKRFHFDWFYPIVPKVFVALTIMLLIVSLFKKRDLLEPYEPVANSRN
jgi:hypothetical protein